MDYLPYVAEKLFKRKFLLYRDEEVVEDRYTIDKIRYEIASGLFDNDYYCLDLFLITPKRFCNWFSDISSEIASNARGMRFSEEDDQENSIYATQLKENIDEFVNMLVPRFTSAVTDSANYSYSDADVKEDIDAIISETLEQSNVTDIRFIE